MASTQANTWPPLLSGGSQDELIQTQLYGKEVIASVLFEAAPDDEFFFPVDGVLSGFAFDGRLYQNGAEVPDADPASWFSEEPGAYRGTRAQFPQRGLVLVTDAGLSIIDLESRYAMWMVALRGDTFGLTHNFLDNISGFTPSGVSYQNGRVVVTLSPDPGSTFTAPVFIVFDFVTDEVYMERPAYRPPVVLPYSPNPATYLVGEPIADAVPGVDLVTGGKPTFWWAYPQLPSGLTLDTETGIVRGTPTTVTTPMAYQIVAYNPGGYGETVWTVEVVAPPPPLGTPADILIYGKADMSNRPTATYCDFTPNNVWLAYNDQNGGPPHLLQVDRTTGATNGDLMGALQAFAGETFLEIQGLDALESTLYLQVTSAEHPAPQVYAFNTDTPEDPAGFTHLVDMGAAEAVAVDAGADPGVVIPGWVLLQGLPLVGVFYAMWRSSDAFYIYTQDTTQGPGSVTKVDDALTVDSLGAPLEAFEALDTSRANPWGDGVLRETRTLGCRRSPNWDPEGRGYNAVQPEMAVFYAPWWGGVEAIRIPAVYPDNDPTGPWPDVWVPLAFCVWKAPGAAFYRVFQLFAQEQPQDGPTLYRIRLRRHGTATPLEHSWETLSEAAYATVLSGSWPQMIPQGSDADPTVYIVGLPTGMVLPQPDGEPPIGSSSSRIRTVLQISISDDGGNYSETLLTQADPDTWATVGTEGPPSNVLGGDPEPLVNEDLLLKTVVERGWGSLGVVASRHYYYG